MKRTPKVPIGWLSTTQYSRHYGVSTKTVRKWMALGLVQTYRLGRLIRVQHLPPRAAD